MNQNEIIRLHCISSLNDISYKKKLYSHLSLLVRQLKLEVSDSVNIFAGVDKAKTIKEYLINADIILLLLSADSMSESEIYQNQINKALTLQAEQKTVFIPIIIRPFDAKLWLEQHKLLSFPINQIPISLSENQDKAYQNIVESLKKVIDNLGKIRKGLELKSLFQTELNQAKQSANSNLLTLPPPLPPKAFIGRSKDLIAIHQLLKKTDNLVLVNGIGGIGKSTLAHAYWHGYQHEFNYVIWLNVVNEDIQEAFINSGLEEELDITPSEKSTLKQRFRTIKRKLSQKNGVNLLILDNINSPNTIKDFSLPNWKVMITSRTNLSDYTQHTVGILSKEDAQILFLHYCPLREYKADLLEKLLRVIGYHTLTIELLAKNLNKLIRKGYSLEDLNNDLELRGLLNISQTSKVASETNKVKEGRYHELITAIFDISSLSPYGRNLLLQFAILPSTQIEHNHIFNLLKINNIKKQHFDDSLDELKETGWLEYDENNGTYKLHQVIQEVVKKKIPPTDKNCKEVLSYLTIFFDYEKNDTRINEISSYNIYAKSVLKALANTKTYLVGMLYQNTANVNHLLGMYEISIELAQKAVTIWSKKCETKKYELAASYNTIGMNHEHLGNFKEAIEFYEKSLSIKNKLYESDNLDTADSYKNIANVHYKMGKYEVAIGFYRKGLQIVGKLDPKNKEIFELYNNLGSAYSKNGNYDKALSIHEKVILNKENVLSPNNLSLAQSYANIAEAYYGLKSYDDAIEYSNKSIAIKETIFSKYANHTELGISYHDIAEIYVEMKKHEEAYHFYKKSVDIFEKYYGKKHYITAHSYSCIAKNFRGLKNYAEAFIFHNKAINIQKKIHPNHFLIAESYMELAITYWETTNFKTAKENIDFAIDIFQKNRHSFLDKALKIQKQINQSIQENEEQNKLVKV